MELLRLLAEAVPQQTRKESEEVNDLRVWLGRWAVGMRS